MFMGWREQTDSDPRPVLEEAVLTPEALTSSAAIHYTKVAHSQPWSIMNHSDAFTHILFKLRSFKNPDFCFP